MEATELSRRLVGDADIADERPLQGSLLRHRGLFKHSEYAIGDNDYSLDVIEHGVLRRNARAPYALRRTLKDSDPRALAAPPELDPRIHFALNCGARSCPLVRPYDAAGLDDQLDGATTAYFAQEAVVDRAAGAATLPGLCKLYKADFGDRDALILFAEAHLGEGLQGLKIGFANFDWTLLEAPASAPPRTTPQT